MDLMLWASMETPPNPPRTRIPPTKSAEKIILSFISLLHSSKVLVSPSAIQAPNKTAFVELFDKAIIKKVFRVRSFRRRDRGRPLVQNRLHSRSRNIGNRLEDRLILLIRLLQNISLRCLRVLADHFLSVFLVRLGNGDPFHKGFYERAHAVRAGFEIVIAHGDPGQDVREFVLPRIHQESESLLIRFETGWRGQKPCLDDTRCDGSQNFRHTAGLDDPYIRTHLE